MKHSSLLCVRVCACICLIYMCMYLHAPTPNAMSSNIKSQYFTRWHTWIDCGIPSIQPARPSQSNRSRTQVPSAIDNLSPTNKWTSTLG